MREFRLWARAAVLADSPRLPKDVRAAAEMHPVNACFLSPSERAPLPLVQGLRVGSPTVVLDLAQLVTGAGGIALLGRFLYLVERYYNLPLRLKLESAALRQ